MELRFFRKVIIAILISGTVIISGCEKSTYYQLTDEEMAWLVYKNNELLTFTNSSGFSFTYLVTLRTKAYIRKGDVYSEYTHAYFKQLNDTTALFSADSNGDLHLSKGQNGFLATFTWPHFALKQVPLSTMTPTAETIGGIIYSDVFVLDGSALVDLRNYQSKLWVSKSFGILQMEDATGELWIRELN